MKRLLVLIVFLLIVPVANAQVLISLLFGETLNTGKVEFGLDGGVNLVTIAGIDQAQQMFTWTWDFTLTSNSPTAHG